MLPDLAKFGRLTAIAAFLLLLLAPTIQMSIPIVQITPLDENRDRAGPPALQELARPAAFTASLQRWFQDNYGFRDLLVRLKTQLDYSVFGSSDRLHIGRDGWLYYRSVIDHQEPAVEAMSDADLDATVANFARLRDWLSGRGVQLIVITNQLKDKFYPEFLPKSASRALKRHRFDEFRAKLHRLTGITYIDTTPTLLRLKEERQIFFKTDFHWNDPAAFVIAGQLVDAVAALDHRPLPVWHNTLKIRVEDFSGAEARFMPLFYPPHEAALMVEPTWPNLFTIADGPEPFEQTYRTPADSERLPPTVVLGDSFFDHMIWYGGLLNYFQVVERARWHHAPFETVLASIPPNTRFFVLQFIEITLPFLRALKVPSS